MFIDRLPSGSPAFCLRWTDFLKEWRTADHADKCVLPDGRPAVRRDGDPRPTYTTVSMPFWDILRHKLKAAYAARPAPKRVRLCAGCLTEMEVARELAEVWTFRCKRCRSVEIHSKRIVGGTLGAGETEKR